MPPGGKNTGLAQHNCAVGSRNHPGWAAGAAGAQV